LFQVVFTQLDTTQAGALRMGDVSLEPFALEMPTTKFDLTLFMADRADGLRLSLRARTDLYRADSVERFLGHVQRVLEAVVADPEARVSNLPLLTSAEERQLDAWNATAPAIADDATIVSLFQAQAARVPARTAVRSGERSLTFADLDALSTRLARRLAAIGAEPSRPVVVMLDRSPELVAAFLGVMKTGSPYVPIASDVPPARVRQYVAESGAAAAITVARHVADLGDDVATICFDRNEAAIAAEPLDALATKPSAEALAYVLFTSGSTGTPKGVSVTQRNIVHYTRAISRVLADTAPSAGADGLAALDGWHFGMVSGVGADLGNTAVFPALCAGGTLHVLPMEATTEPTSFAEYMSAHPIDVLKITPSHLRALRMTGNALPAKWLVLGGEPLHWDVATQLTADVAATGSACRILNHYGPTETTVGCTTFEVTERSATEARELGAHTAPIGFPLDGITLHVLDAHMQPVPVGVPGELSVGGAGVTAGYLQRPHLTAERFVHLDGVGRVYRTGDRVRRLANGAVEFLGRGDDQVKIRGYRVELGEIEQVLRAHELVGDAVVVARDGAGEHGGEGGLVAYVVQRATASGNGDEGLVATLHEWIAARVPDYMVPGVIVVLERMPLLASGKVDREALPVPDGDHGAREAPLSPRTPTEVAIARIWADVLKKPSIGVRDNFIELGGHSLMAIRILGRLSKQFGVRLPLRALFDAPTVAELAELVDLETQLAALENMSEADAARLLQGQGGEDTR
ncbi:MAG TPA: amino acid adenylation domain-containing protein, partial [Candidatus Elarobacter sp.]|nr:amino acid adenylation domain-containing protein [Candidatus Elarobacter sp.]